MKKIYLLFCILSLTLFSYSQGCLPEGITFTTQEQIDNFPSSYPLCTEIEGDVTIHGDSINNLEGLSQITIIDGYLYIWSNDSLYNLMGLNNLVEIGGYLELVSNPELNDLSALENLSILGGSLLIWENNNLESINVFENLDAIEGELRIIGANISDISGFDNLTSIAGDMGIGGIWVETDLNGLNNVTTIGGDFGFGATYLTSCSILANLNYIGESIFFYDILNISNLPNLSNLTSINGMLKIHNTSFTSLNGLNNITSIGDDLQIFESGYLTSLDGLNNLISIGGHFEVWDSNGIINLEGLNNLTSVDGRIYIGANASIESLDGLGYIDANTIQNLNISNNSSLTTCDAQSICDYLASPNGQIDISDNAAGCNSIEEVVEACLSNTIEIPTNVSDIRISPNPAKNTIYISSAENIVIMNIILYTQTGQKALSIKSPHKTINISNLPPGLYIAEIKTNEGDVMRKIIIQ